MIREESGSSVKVIGSSIEIEISGEIPGNTPTRVPTNTPIKQ
jgi:hypothetical protein